MKKISSIFLAIILSACGGGDDGGDDKQTSKISSVIYEVNVLYGEARITKNLAGSTSQTSTTKGSYTFSSIAKDDDFLYLSAQKEGSSGMVTVKIIVDGKVFKQATSSAAYGIATASGTCCK